MTHRLHLPCIRPITFKILFWCFLSSLALVDSNLLALEAAKEIHDDSVALPPRHLIVGGQPADPDRFPYYARLDYEGEFGCGGTLIRRDFVLSAAHCAFPNDDLGILTATIGATTLNGTTAPQATQRLVKQIIRHPTYTDNSDINDIALLKIDPVDWDVPTVRLNADRAAPPVGHSVTAIGLGLTEEGGDDSDVLREVELKVVDDSLCDERFEGYLHRKSMLCAKDEGQDSCDGDSGGPLVVLGDAPADDVQVGVVSFGDECAHESIPGVYADVSYVYPWIENTLCAHSVDPPVGCQNATDSIYIEEGSECRDYPGAFYANWWYQFQRCDWLNGRIEDFCYISNEAWVQCPFTCHSCTYLEDDDIFDDDETFYEESSSPVIMAMLLVVSFLLCCVACCWSVQQLRKHRHNGHDLKQEEAMVLNNKEINEGGEVKTAKNAEEEAQQ